MQELYNLTNLKILDLSDNRIESIKSSHDNGRQLSLLNLEKIDLKDNLFDNSILAELSGFSNLKSLDIRWNKLNGSVDAKELHLLSNVENLFLDSTPLDISFLQSIGVLTSLKTLSLSYCDLTDLPTHQGLCYLNNLEELNLNGNALSGAIPSCLGNLTSLRYLDISNNRFTGNIASSPLTNLTMLQFISLSKNQFQLPVSFNSFANHSHLKVLLADENKLVAEPIGFQIWWPKFQLMIFSLFNCTIEEHGTLRLPNFLYFQRDLRFVDLSLCNFGEIRLQSLSILDLSQNKLSGHIPSCLSNLTLKPRSEKSYDVSSDFGLPLLDELMVDMGLTTYDLIGDSETEKNYPFIFQEEEVEFSTKGARYTYKGIILELLSAIDLSCNQLTGIIPPGLGNLSEIRGLNLSHNNLTGPIPSTFSKLKQIESLDLSYNNLNGRIPPQLTKVTTLEVFSVAHNNLSGPLPDRKNQFGTFEESSFKGNPLLCGPPLNKSCHEGDSPGTPSASSSEKEHGFLDMGDFYISFAVSFAIIFLAAIIVLYINPYWRRACF
ncbi:hypothetical protein PVK06_034704 [Gossypium arboreum]|uniref:LRR receptor-like serine/threonine-protein kinase At4g36180 n=1 Tax=Gossypium arboreum TaxID=29729 RepID=A0ABR0NEW8_GOSAR|nr:hypothetical protein PVK06_034704 [Gossypium arboreum]